MSHWKDMAMEAGSSYVEGVGDEVLLTATFIVIAVSILVLVFRPNLDLTALFGRQADAPAAQNNFTPQAQTNGATEQEGAPAEGGAAPTVAAVPAPRRARSGSVDSACPICLAETIRHGIETNCGHLFCAQCLFTYRDHGSFVGPMKCALCRQPVTLLFPSFTEDELNAAEPDDIEARERARSESSRYNRRFSGEPRELMEYLRDLPTLLRHLWTEFFSEGGLFLMFRVRVVVCFLAALLYVASPLDILPEAVFGLLGLFDDIFIMVLIIIYVSVIYRRYVAARL
ncbi:E3 ubiquitin-protein ligase RNF170-like [Amphibalanus amphitrite]|uniref:E3 ubiquitin-protein ligase RNF170-like n=1 Tax=Amphibalanus amphitrite TaxID=1232801 RepID=UPI001C903725|nr:E3 ubiquitin-protein ligase RNF170-like [Amphibalanus amphitrite]XP_043241605.1 E3 ubiquitin-protein ligase RNF170-like [Amphibalanus amphitrite]XP_043241606.1 E3 ubiquitin-protein ligase RNF170-like [Amphibalanus amphitrite]XP_043241607.1 E3 ubiquitin-protein ligase RNF170-like [Amphibalanus amphitrite]XP_043241608.1 E3 ubiquitin-protein ligase RNF170-like [Amphibalanus amphitrite]